MESFCISEFSPSTRVTGQEACPGVTAWEFTENWTSKWRNAGIEKNIIWRKTVAIFDHSVFEESIPNKHQGPVVQN